MDFMFFKSTKCTYCITAILILTFIVIRAADASSNYTIDIKDILKDNFRHKDKCRHIVRKEIQKYTSRVRMLTNLVISLQQDVTLLRKEQERQQLQIQLLTGNVTEQKDWQVKTDANIEYLLRQNWHSNSTAASVDPTVMADFPTDCDVIYKAGGMKFPGTYEMNIQPADSASAFKVLCEPINYSGWIVIQSRFDGSESFRRSWIDYKKGFGTLQSEFWIGNEHIYQLTANGDFTLRVEIEEFSGRQHWAEYSRFRVDNETASYALHIDGYSGNAGNAMKLVNGQKFSTFDKDNDKEIFNNCANQNSAGWWYKTCTTSNVNGQYLDQSTHNSFAYDHGIVWYTVHPYKSLKKTRLLIKPSAKSVG